MESKSYSQLFEDLADALNRWADELPGLDNKQGKLEFCEYVRIAKASLVVKLVAEGHGNLVAILDDSLTDLFYKGLGLATFCDQEKPPRDKTWEQMSLVEKSERKDLQESISRRAISLRSELAVCNDFLGRASYT